MTFRHKNSGAATTIGLLVHADRGERVETVRARFVARGYAFSFADFIERDADGDEVIVPHHEIIERLKKRCGKELTLHSAASQFVAEYLATMRPRSSPEARLFLRSFNNAVLAREIRDPTDFVRRFVLEAEPLNVERIRSSIETWRLLEKRAQALESELRAVRAVRSRFATWARQILQAQTEEYVSVSAERMRLELEIEDLTKVKERAETERARLRRLIANHSDAVNENRNEILRKLTMIAQSGDGGKIRAIEVEEREAGNDQMRAGELLKSAIAGLVQVSQFSALRPFVPIKFHGAIDAAAELGRATHGKPVSALAAEIDHLIDAARHVLAILAARDALAQQRDARVEDIAAVRKAIANLEQSLRGAGEGRASMLSAQVRQFMDDLAVRGIESIALPDAVEIADASWAPRSKCCSGPTAKPSS